MDHRPMIAAIAAIVLAATPTRGPAQTAQTAEAGQESQKLAQIFEEYFQANLELNPIFATFIGDHRFDDRMANSIGPEYRAESEALQREYLARIQAIDAFLLEGQDFQSYNMFLRARESAIEGLRFPGYLVPINQFFSAPNFFAQLGSGASVQPFGTVQDYDNWLGRVDDFTVWIDQAIVNMREGLAAGVTRPKVIMAKALPQLAAHVVEDPEKSLFYSPIGNMPEEVPEAERERLESAYRDAIADKIVPAYARLHDFIRDEYIPGAIDAVGMNAVPGGDEWYAYLVKQTTTTDLTPDEIHEIGLSEVARIHEEMLGVMADVGFEGSLPEFWEFLKSDPQFYFDEREQLLQSYRDMKATAAAAADQLFSLKPEADFEVRAVEEFREQSASGASYQRAAPDGSRPGIFYVNTYDLSARPRYATEALFLHEAIPGHHFQIGIQQELDELPMFRRFGGYTAFSEGWALYAESLGKELGMYTDPYMYYGKLQAELWRAIRLVTDTGIHQEGWTREQVLEYMYANSDAAETRAVSEAERFIAIPSQALAYKIGQLKIQELRDRAEAALGEDFDIKEFHAQVIGQGALPLDLLEARVDAWIARRR